MKEHEVRRLKTEELFSAFPTFSADVSYTKENVPLNLQIKYDDKVVIFHLVWMQLIVWGFVM